MPSFDRTVLTRKLKSLDFHHCLPGVSAHPGTYLSNSRRTRIARRRQLPEYFPVNRANANAASIPFYPAFVCFSHFDVCWFLFVDETHGKAPIFSDSPLSIGITDLFTKYTLRRCSQSFQRILSMLL